MAYNDGALATFRESLVWASPTAPDWGEILGQCAAKFEKLGLSDTRFRATLKQSSTTTIDTKFDERQAWLEALGGPFVDAGFDGRLGDAGSLSLRCDPDWAVIRLDVRCEPSKVEILTAVVVDTPPGEKLRAFSPGDYRFERDDRYRSRARLTGDALFAAVGALRSEAWLPRFQGDIERNGARITKRNLDDFVALLSHEEQNEDSVSIRLHSEAVDVHLDSRPDGETAVRVRSFDEDLGELLMLVAQEALGLVQSGAGPNSLVGVSAKYAFRQPPMASWARLTIQTVQEVGKFQGDFRGEVEFVEGGDSPTNRVTYADPDEFADLVEESWPRISWSYLYFRWRDLVVIFRCDVGREIVEVSLEASTRDAAQEKIDGLTEQLELDLAPKPLYTVRSTAEYAITWRNSNFAAALRATVEQFVPGRPVLEDGRVLNADGSVETFRDVEAFLQRVGAEAPYRKLYFAIGGSRGNALGMDLEVESDSRTILKVRSTTSPQEFPQLIASLKAGFSVVKTEAVVTEPASAASRRLDILVRVGLPLATLALGFVLSGEFWQAASADDSVTITFPLTPSSGAVETSGTSVRLEWVVRHEQWWRSTTSRTTSASVRVFQDGNLLQEQTRSPGANVPLPEAGLYVIEVVHPETNASDHIEISVVTGP